MPLFGCDSGVVDRVLEEDQLGYVARDPMFDLRNRGRDVDVLEVRERREELTGFESQRVDLRQRRFGGVRLSVVSGGWGAAAAAAT